MKLTQTEIYTLFADSETFFTSYTWLDGRIVAEPSCDASEYEGLDEEEKEDHAYNILQHEDFLKVIRAYPESEKILKKYDIMTPDDAFLELMRNGRE